MTNQHSPRVHILTKTYSTILNYYKESQVCTIVMNKHTSKHSPHTHNIIKLRLRLYFKSELKQMCF